MKTTWYKLSPRPETVLEMPVGATALSVQIKDGEPHLLVLEDLDKPKTERRSFWTSEAGKLAPRRKYVGTFMLKQVGSGEETWDDVMGRPTVSRTHNIERFFCVFEGEK